MSGLVVLLLRLLLAAILFGFCGWAIWVIWQDLRASDADRFAVQRPVLVLSRDHNEQQAVFRVKTVDVLLGRSPGCDLSLDDPTISAHHARLAFHHSQWWVEDLTSRNGTFLNDQPVLDPVVLTSGDILRCGQIDLQITIEATD